MKTNAPNGTIWIIAVILGILGILLELKVLKIASLTRYIFWLVAAAFIILALATILKGV